MPSIGPATVAEASPQPGPRRSSAEEKEVRGAPAVRGSEPGPGQHRASAQGACPSVLSPLPAARQPHLHRVGPAPEMVDVPVPGARGTQMPAHPRRQAPRTERAPHVQVPAASDLHVAQAAHLDRSGSAGAQHQGVGAGPARERHREERITGLAAPVRRGAHRIGPSSRPARWAPPAPAPAAPRSTGPGSHRETSPGSAGSGPAPGRTAAPAGTRWS